MDRVTTHIRLNFDTVLEHLGFLARSDDGVDFARSQLYSYSSPDRSLVKKVRFALAGREEGGRVAAADRSAIRNRIESALETVTYAGGARSDTSSEPLTISDFGFSAHSPARIIPPR
jgi:hypothetical protein